MVSHENRVIVGYGAAALLIMHAMVLLTGLPQWMSVAALFVVGILVPQVINNRLDRPET